MASGASRERRRNAILQALATAGPNFLMRTEVLAVYLCYENKRSINNAMSKGTFFAKPVNGGTGRWLLWRKGDVDAALERNPHEKEAMQARCGRR